MQSAAMGLAISEALVFHHGIGPSRQGNYRMHAFSHFCAGDQLRPSHIFNSWESSQTLASFLWTRHRILVQAVSSRLAPKIGGVRVTPNVYTTLAESDLFCDAIGAVANNGLSKAF